jgi:Methylamine utilisation protein MauE
MVETITPVVHGGSRGKWGLSVGLHTVGATGSAALAGALLGAAGAALGAPWGRVGFVAVSATALAYAVREAGGPAVPIPAARRQVPDWWRTFFGPHVAALLYGVGLGLGFMTYLSHGTLVAVALATFATGDPALGAVAVGTFGLARGLSLLLPGPAPTAVAAGASVDRLIRLGTGSLPRMANGLALAALAAAAGLAASEVDGGPIDGPDLAMVATVILAAAFGWAALAKATRPSSWRAALRVHDLGALELPAAVAVPVAELTVAVVLVLVSARAGAVAGLALLLAFSLSLLRVRVWSGKRRVPCGCFGRRTSVDVRLALVRNAVLGCLGALALVGQGSTVSPLGPPSPGEVVPALLALAGLTLGAWVSREVLRIPHPAASSPPAGRSAIGSRS